MTPALLYITAAHKEEAATIARVLLEKRLAACINILGAITSLYRWEGEIKTGNEVALIAKTRSDLIDEATEAVQEIHSYDCPCVIALPIQGGNPDFLQWIEDETVL